MPAMSTLPRTPYIVAYVALLVTAVSVAVMAVQPSPRDLSKLARPGVVATKAASSALTTHQAFTDGMAAPSAALSGAVIDKAFEATPQVVAQRRK